MSEEELDGMIETEAEIEKRKWTVFVRPVYCRDCYSPMKPTYNKYWNRFDRWTCVCGRFWARVDENHWETNIGR